MSKVCYVVFDANRSKPYAYLVGRLSPQPGKLVVVRTAGNKYKVVECVGLADEDHRATAPLFATLQEQTDHVPSL